MTGGHHNKKEEHNMKFSSKVEKCGLSPMRKFHPYAVAAKARGINIYHLNIGQPDVQTDRKSTRLNSSHSH